MYIKFQCNKKKLSYIVHKIQEKKNIFQQDIAKELKISTSTLSKYLGSTDGATLKLKQIHIYAILSTCGLPKEIFTECNTKEEIDSFIEKNQNETTINNPNIPNELKNLLGTSYLYSYHNNIKIHASLHDILPEYKKVNINLINKVIINIDNYCTVTDQHNNVGKLIKLTDDLSIIFIEDRNNKDTIVYTFDNHRVHLKQFLFGKRSKLNHSNEMLSFGFFSREELSEEFIEIFLDKETSKTQLKVQTEFLEQLCSYNQIEEC